jgi:hypothetical protein
MLYVRTDLDSECRALAFDVEIQCNYEVVPDIPVDWVCGAMTSTGRVPLPDWEMRGGQLSFFI